MRCRNWKRCGQRWSELTAYEENGAPFGLRWFLYSTKTGLPRAVTAVLHYARFNQLLFLQTQGKMLASLLHACDPTRDHR